MIQNQARKQNHPNVSAGITVPTSNAQNRQRQESKGKPAPESELEIRRALKTDAAQDSGEAPAKETTRPSRKKYCIFHGMAGHDIAECHSFIKKTVGEREQWIFEEGLCFRCLSPNHEAYKCKENVRCSICGSRRHPNLLHWDSEERKEKGKEKEKSKEGVDNANPKCTSICNGNPGGLSCGKTVLVDVYSEEHPDDIHRVYAIVDDQSNASMITNDLADKLSSTTSQPAEARRRSDTVGE